MGWHPCCCAEIECSRCSGDVPSQMRVTIDGITDTGNCNQCDENCNGIFICDHVAADQIVVCQWKFIFDPYCAYQAQQVQVTLTGNYIAVAIQFALAEGQVAVWTKYITAPIDCVSLDITVWDSLNPGAGDVCNAAGATCHLEAL